MGGLALTDNEYIVTSNPLPEVGDMIFNTTTKTFQGMTDWASPGVPQWENFT